MRKVSENFLVPQKLEISKAIATYDVVTVDAWVWLISRTQMKTYLMPGFMEATTP